MTYPTNTTLPTVDPTPHDVTPTHQHVGSSDASLIQQFPEERAALLRRLNSLQSKTRNLPPEILSSIFRHAFPPWDIKPHVELAVETYMQAETNPHIPKTEYQRDTPLVLGAVSSHWRQVAWSTPRLWASLVIRPLPETANNAAALLQFHAQNSASLGLHIQVICRIHSEKYSNFFAEGVRPFADSLFFSASTPRITTLVFYNAPTLWSPHLSMGLSMLETLVYVWASWEPKILRVGPSDIILANMPSLRQLSLGDISGEIAPVGDTIQTLTLCNLPIDVIAGILFRCPNLLSFCSFRNLDVLRNTRLLSRNFTLEHLEYFEWVDEEVDHWRIFVLHLHLPSLKFLHLMLYLPVYDPDIANFFTRLPQSLSTLQLSHCYDVEGILVVLCSCPQLQELILYHSANSVIHHLLNALAPAHSNEGHSMKEAKILPNLRVLSVIDRDDGYGSKVPLHVSDKILEMVEQRLRGLVGCLNFKFAPAVVFWETTVKERLREMVKDGSALQILEDNHLVDWLC